jgi:hypothetical protein
MKKQPFNRRGLFFKPTSWAGWLILIAAIGYAAFVFADLNNRAHSVSDLMINFVFRGIIIGAMYSLVAYLSIMINK